MADGIQYRLGQQVTMAAGACRDQVIVDNAVLIDIFHAVVAGIAKQVVVHRHLPSAHQMSDRREEPQAVADDSLHNILAREDALQELAGRRQLRDVLRIAQAVGHHAGGDDERRVGVQLVVCHILETLRAVERRTELVSLERDARVPPEAREEMHLVTLFGETKLVVEDFVLVEIALDQYTYFILFLIHKA